MTLRPVSHYLVCFDAGVQPPLEGDGAPEPRVSPAPSVAPDEDPVDAVGLAWDQGREAGYAAGFADARRDAEETQAALKLALAQQMERGREEWAGREGEALGANIMAMLSRVEERVGASVARALRPVLAEAVCEKAVRELIECVRLMFGRDQPLIAVSGRADLLEAMKLRLGDEAACVAFAVNDECDVRIIVDQTLIESRVRSWIETLERLSE